MCRSVSPTSEMRVDTRMRKAYPPWAKWKRTGNEIDIETLFNGYWNTNKHEFTASSQSRPANRPFISYREIADVVVVGKHSGSLILQFSTNPTVRLFVPANTRQLIVLAQAESLRSSLQELEGLLDRYPPLMSGSTERVLDKVIAYGVVFAEVSFSHMGTSKTLTLFS
jgi:hypothetical protein